MAHDFGIRNTKKKEFYFFFGYADGLMYRAFGEEKHDAFVSGDNGTELKTTAETGCTFMIPDGAVILIRFCPSVIHHLLKGGVFLFREYFF